MPKRQGRRRRPSGTYFVDDLLLGEALLAPALGQELHQVAHGEVGGVALATVAELLAVAEGVVVRQSMTSTL